MAQARSDSAQTPDHDRPRGRPALLIIDMINCFDFPGAELLEPKAVRAAQAISRLRKQVARSSTSTIILANGTLKNHGW